MLTQRHHFRHAVRNQPIAAAAAAMLAANAAHLVQKT
jgi:hypothetical protein